MKLILYNFFYRIGLLSIFDTCLSKMTGLKDDIHLFLIKKKLEKRNSLFGKNTFIDTTVRFRIHEKAKVIIGDNVNILNDSWLIAEEGDEIVIGNNTFISQNVVISGNVKIGSNVLIAGYVSIIDANHNFDDVNKNINEQGGNKRDIEIGSDIWIGSHSVVLQGVKIADHSIIGANSTVTHDVNEYVIVAGSPAKIVKVRK
jgi:acetyltransferase-like isoleucine patch superfamily enzyme